MISNEIRASLKKTCFALNNQEVEYLLIGGVAVGYYGFQRISGAGYPGRPEITQDIDFWYRPSLENYLRLVKALDQMKIETNKKRFLFFYYLTSLGKKNRKNFEIIIKHLKKKIDHHHHLKSS